MPIPKTAIEYLKSERTKQTAPYQKFYDEAIAALEKVNAFQNGNDHVIVLPAMLGTTVYCLAQPCGGCECYNEPMREKFIARCRECDRWEIIQCNFDYELIPEYGKTVFLTREEAEAALKERERG